MTRMTTILAAFVLFGLFSATQVAAQSQQTDPWVFKADAGVVHQSDTDLTDGGGGFSVDRWFVSAGMDYVWNLRNSIGFSVGSGTSNYDFEGTGGFGGGNPWNKIEDTRVSVTWRFGFGKTGLFTLIPTARFNGENGASSGDSRTYGLYAVAAWRINEGLSIGPGIGVFSRLENSARIFPILAIEWDISDRWNLSTGRGLAASQGPGLTLSYKLSDAWTLGFAGRYEYVEFRLDDAGVAAGGVGRDESLPLVFTARLEPSPKFSVSVFAGAEIMGTLNLKDALGNFVDESSYDPAPIFGAALEARF
ncbi:MAG: hypothetical protein BMS9Abin30_1053 [Gammaproteobacteria bacterium]|nr:MAG: hypothetical protein BMS9Abin30_1053 [Gammaproteobacteria bacterium]